MSEIKFPRDITFRKGEPMKPLVIRFSREEALACAIALSKEKPYKWRKQALSKVDKALGGKSW